MAERLVVIRLHQLADGRPDQFNGSYVVEYDPTRPGAAPDGSLLDCHLITTRDRSKALKLTTEQAFALYNKVHGVRHWDGMANKPLTSYHVSFEPADEEAPFPFSDNLRRPRG